MKNKILFFLLLTSTNCALGEGVSSRFSVSGGFGGAFGSTGKLKTDVSNCIPTNNLGEVGLESTKSLKMSGFTGDLALGYTYLWKSFGFGGDLFFTLSSLKKKNKNVIVLEDSTDPDNPYKNHAEYRIQQRYGLGIRLRPGILLGETRRIFLHGIIGAVLSEFKSISHITELRAHNQPYTFNFRSKKLLPGLVVGAGIAHQITPRFSVGIEGTHTLYKNLNHKFDSHPGSGPGEEVLTLKIKPQETRVMLRVSYTFGDQNTSR